MTCLFDTYSPLPVYLIDIHPYPFIKSKEKILPSLFIRFMSPLAVYYFLFKNPVYPGYVAASTQKYLTRTMLAQKSFKRM